MSTSIWLASPDDPTTGVIWNGSGDPNLVPAFGNPGDFYIDYAVWKIYGPKSSTGWGTGVNMIGGTGVIGPMGPQGPIGPQGPQGVKGDKGDTGAAGANGSAGPAGTPGSKIFVGSTDPDSLLGNTGDLYLNGTNGDIWGPKDAIAGWGTSPSGNIRGPAPTLTQVKFGQLNATNNSTAIAITAAVDPTLNTNTDYKQITGVWQTPPYGVNNGVTQGAASLTITKTGTYKIEFWASLTSSNPSTNIAIKFAVNGSIGLSRKPWAKIGTGGDKIMLSAHGIHNFSAGDVVTLWIAADASSNITIFDSVCSLTELGISG